ncbi:MAG: helix-turn-helix transcriptional regulator [Kiritimatiellia bacterium]
MQAKYESFLAGVYDTGMQTGRPTSRQRPPFGERLYALREAAGLSQQQVADRLGMKHSAYAWWERHPVALRPDQIGKLTEILNVSVDELFSKEEKNGRRGGGPVGKARRLFEAVSKLPRSQQQHVLTVVEAFVEKKAAAAQ